jgi:hypothetical protein
MAAAGQHLKLPSHILSTLLIIVLVYSTIVQATCVPATSIERRFQPAPKCSDPHPDDCSFYKDCVESRYKCGSSGYPLGYGKKYCEKFQTDRETLTAAGKTWMVDTMHCLQLVLVPEATGSGEGVTCDSIQKKAFGSHAKCYVDNGLCGLGPTEWIAIVKIVGINTLFQDKDAFMATMHAVEKCAVFYAWQLKHLFHGN